MKARIEDVLGPRGRVWLVVGLAALAALLVYANSLPNQFAYDDYWIIESREMVHSLGRLGQIWATGYWPPGFRGGLYRPLTMTSYAVDWTLWGGSPLAFHLVNVLLHAAASALVGLLLLEFFPWWAALAGGVVFAVHPIHTEAVANVVGRAELLSAVFVLAAALIYVRAARHGRISPPALAGIALAYALSMLTKESGVVLPGLLLTLDLGLTAWRRSGGWRAYVRSRVPLFAVLTFLLTVYMGLRLRVLGAALENVPARAFAVDASFSTRLFTMARVWPRYFELLVAPTHLSADYSPAVILPVHGPTPIGTLGFLLLGILVLIAVLGYRKTPELGMAAGWAALALLPVCNLLIVSEILLAERTLYLPSVAVAVIVALALARADRRARQWLGAGLCAWVTGFSVVTVRRNPVWRNTQSVFESIRRSHPESSRLLWEVGEHYRHQGDWTRAKEWFERSLAIWPHHAPYLGFFAVYLREHGELEEAEERIAEAIRLEPGHVDYYTLLAAVRLDRGEPQAALSAARRGLERAEPDRAIYRALAAAHSQLGERSQAVAAQQKAIRVGGNEVRPIDWLDLAALQAAAGDTAAALTTVREGRARWVPRDTAAFDRAAAALSGREREKADRSVKRPDSR